MSTRVTATRAPTLGRQRTLGRPAIQRCGGAPCACPPEHRDVQRTPAVSSPGDRFEREADQVADTIMRQAEEGPGWSEETRRRDLEEEKQAEGVALQRKAADGAARTDTDIGGRLALTRDGGRPLGEETRAFMEPRFGHSFADIRVHTDANAAGLCDDLSARAFTYGSDVYFAAQSFAPETADGRRLIAHELTHVVQQRSSAAEIHRECRAFPDHTAPDTYCETQAEAAARVENACPPDAADFVYRDGPPGFLWRRLPGYGCAHYVAHRLGITTGAWWENCQGGFSVTIDQITEGRTPFPLAEARVGDIWVQGGFHSGLVTQVQQDATGAVREVTVNQCNTRGQVRPIEMRQGTFYR